MKKQEKRLEFIYGKLDKADKKTLLDFAEFLFSRSGPVAGKISQPLDIPIPAEENVVSAIKRLSRQYFMLDKMKVFPLTSQLMTEHIMKGRQADEVIAELEIIFKEHYELYIADFKENSGGDEAGE